MLTRFARRPMVFFGGLGTLAFLLGFAILAWISFEKLALGHPIGDRPMLLFGVMLAILGTQSFLAGFLGEMIVRPEMEGTSRLEVREEAAPVSGGGPRLPSTREQAEGLAAERAPATAAS